MHRLIFQLVVFVFVLSVLGSEVLKDDPFYGKRVKDYPDYAERERRVKPKVMQSRVLTSRSRVGSLQEAERLFYFAGMTYCSNHTTGIYGSQYVMGMGGRIRVMLVMENANLQVRSILAIDPIRKQILLGFRGTAAAKNWGDNINFNKVPFGPGVVHAGFKGLTDALLPLYSAFLFQLIDAYPNYRMVIVGHSLGGAIAVLSSVHISARVPWSRISVYTYGQPRVGDEAFVKWLNTRPMEMTRVVNENDGIPHLPPNFAGFYHAHTEVYIHDNTPAVCSTDVIEDINCSSSRIFGPNSKPHSTAFSITLDNKFCVPPPFTPNKS